MTCAEHSPCCPPTLTAEQLAADPRMGEVALLVELRRTYGHHTAVRLWRDAAAIYREHYAQEAAA